VGAYLRDIAELESYVDLIRKEAIPNPTVGIERNYSGFERPVGAGETALYPLDYRLFTVSTRTLESASQKLLMNSVFHREP